MLFLSVIFPLAFIGLVAGNPVVVEDICPGNKVVTSTQFIGKDKNVKMETITCDTPNASDAVEKGALLEAGQSINVCGAACDTHCFQPSGGGPDPNDCHIIADALRFDSQNVGPMFTVATSTTGVCDSNNTLSLSFASCTTFFRNQGNVDLEYCRTDFASLVDFIAPNCQATQNAHGGLCISKETLGWFVQVQHS
ncbi:hypothetical protein BDN70DRAFT_885630 [Pholiota conissans]|uniref:Uncharacterized protein n=1 Tax=Pholiota conissans TaxID=109636 RepID=A0A9P6CVL1_9AGAR|nr:hypothetical protein BDN70DRAFT_885630 [Pholiota conissans]